MLNFKKYLKKVFTNFKSYIKKLLFPLWLFPIKLLTYSTYYILKFIFRIIIAILSLSWDIVSFPFKSIKNFIKSLIYILIIVYIFFSLLVIADYLQKQYGNFNNIWCGNEVKKKLEKSVVRIIGGYGEGSGFFISKTQVVTNFHVIDGEPSPKIVTSINTLETPFKIVGSKDMDIAVLTIKNEYPDIVFQLPDEIDLRDDEPLLSAGYPLGSDVTGGVTIVKGNFIDYRKSRKDTVGYIQTNLSLVKGMSGGPLVDQCGKVVGINTQGLAGISFFITAKDVKENLDKLTDQQIKKINVDPSKSPEDAVIAFYTYLKARRMEDGFNLLSKKYLEKTNLTEWTNRFTDILDVSVIKTEIYIQAKSVSNASKDTVFVKFMTTNWVDGESEYHYYEGTWQTILEDGVYKMNKSKIEEVDNPNFDWYYE